MLAALQSTRRTRSCPPRSPSPPPSNLKRTHSSNDLTAALHLIGLGDNAGDTAGLKSPPTTALSHDINSLVNAGQKRGDLATRPRHARNFSLQKRKKSFAGMSDKNERPNLTSKRARSSDYLDRGRQGSGSYNTPAIVSSASLIDTTPDTIEESPSNLDASSSSLPVSPSTIPRSPSCIGLLEAEDNVPSGYRSLGAISAVVSPTSLHPADPAAMFLAQAEKLDRRLRSEAVRLGATTLANSTIVSVDDSGAMEASGIALVVTEPEP